MIYNLNNAADTAYYNKGDGFMKKILIVVFAAAMAAACSSNKSNVKTADGRAASAKNAKYQIIDQEFDNLLAPEADYDTLPAYELQACGDSYLPPAEVKLKKTAKPAKKQASAKKSATENTTNKKVVNVVNIIETDGPVANLPTAHSGSTTTTTTTYTDGYQR